MITWRPIDWLRPLLAVTILAQFFSAAISFADENIIDFEKTEIGKPIPTWSEQGVTFTLAHEPEKSKAKGRISFFPHLGTDRKGVVNAMANEAIPIRVSFGKPIKKVKLKLWGSTTSAALVQAFDAEGMLIAQDGLDQVPIRQSPEEHVPFFELSVEASNIVYIDVSGSKPGGFVAIDEIRWEFEDSEQAIVNGN